MLGIPAGIQNAIFAIANLFVQTGVNSFDTVMVSGSTAATNADTLIFNVMYAFYTGCSSFMSQNYGARNKKRVLKSYFISLFYSFTTGLILGLLLFIFGHQFMSLFATDAAVIDAGMQRIGLFILCVRFYGLHNCSIPRSWKNRHSYDHYHSGILCFPYCLDLHHFCLDSYNSGIIPSVSLLMDHHIYRRNHLFHNNLQEAVIL